MAAEEINRTAQRGIRYFAIRYTEVEGAEAKRARGCSKKKVNCNKEGNR